MELPLLAVLAAAAGGVLALRGSWGRAGAALTVVGWAAIAAAILAGAAVAGAWGIAMAAVAAVAVALLLLAHAGRSTPAAAGRPPREAPAVSLPRLQPGAIARRAGVFFLVGPMGLAASAVLAMGLGEIARAAAWDAADATALVFFATATAWALLASWQVLRPTRPAMILPAVATAGIGAILWGLA